MAEKAPATPKKAPVMPKSAILWIAGLLIGSIVLTIGLDALFTRNPAHQWATAVQATATLVLVGVTGVYVWITYRQMQLQATPLVAIRLMAQEDAARQAVGLMQRTREKANTLINAMPASDTFDVPDYDKLPPDATALTALANELFILAATLPLRFAPRTFEVCSPLIRSSTEVYMFCNACARETLDATKAERKWTSQGARKIYLADVRKPESGHPEWSELVRLALMRKCVGELQDLQAEISAYLLAPL